MVDPARTPRRLGDVTEILEIFSSAAVEGVGALSKYLKHARRKRVGESLHPGEETPLWNAMVAAIRPHLAQRGAKSNLARILGLPRQRIHEYITRPTVLPDAEVTLHLLLWLQNQENQLKKGRHGQPLA